MFSDVKFAYPIVLWLLLLVPALGYWYWKNKNSISPNFAFSSLQIFGKTPKTLKEKLADLPAWLKILSLAFFIIAAARPQSFSSGENIYTEGIDIAMLLDIESTRMHIAINALLGVFIAMFMFIIILLDHPYTGAIRLKPKAYKEIFTLELWANEQHVKSR